MKRIISLLTVLAILVLSMGTMTLSVFAEGTGTEEDPIIITDVAGFMAMKNGALGTWYELRADLDLGDAYAPFIFKGNLKGGKKADGGKYEITYSVAETNRYAGLFTQMYGTVSNLYVKATASDARLVGAIAGELLDNAQVENCICEVNLSVTESIVGGIAGQMRVGSVIKNCEVRGSINGPTYVGGIVGNVSTGGKVENCVVASGTTIKATGKNVGGIVGYAAAAMTVENCKNSANVTSTNSTIGGIVGYALGITVSKCVNTGRIEGSSYVAGIGASLAGNCVIENCLNTGSIVAPEASGLSAGIIASATNATDVVRYCINSGNIIGKSNYRMPIGTYNNKGTMTNCYYVTPATAYTALFAGETLVSDMDWYTMSVENTLPAGLSDEIWEFVPVSATNTYALPQIIGNNCNEAVYTLDVAVDTVNYGGGDGSQALPYVINNETHFANIALNPAAYFILNNNITVSAPIDSFSGNFNGNNKTIELDIESESNNVGLFATISGDAKIYDLTLTGEVAGGTNVGSLVGLATNSTTNSKVSNITNNASVSANSNAGGIIGHINTSSPAGKTVVESCVNNAPVYSELGAAGGIVALSNGAITNCANLADVTGYTQVGGIVGFAYSSVSKSYNTGKVTATRTGHNNTICSGVAGAVRSANAAIDTCYNVGSVVSDCAAGITSSSAHTSGGVKISNSFNLGAVIRPDGTAPAYILQNDGWTTTFTNVYYLTKDAYDDGNANTTNLTSLSDIATMTLTGYTMGGAYPVITGNAQENLNSFVALTMSADENGTVKLSDMGYGNYFVKAGEAHTLTVIPESGYMAMVSVNDDVLLEESIKKAVLTLTPFTEDTAIVAEFSERPVTPVEELKITTPGSVFVPEVINEGEEYTIKNQDGDFTVKSGVKYGATFSKISGFYGWNIVEFGIDVDGEKYPSKIELTSKGTYGIVFEGLKENITVKPYVVYQNAQDGSQALIVYGEEALIEVE